jgi:GTP-binding protein
MMERDVYLGRILTGRIASGVVRVGDRVHGLRGIEGNSTPFDECKVNTIIASFLLKCAN